MDDEQYYLFVDKTGHCFEDFQKSSVSEPDEFDKFFDKSSEEQVSGEKYYRDHVGAMMRSGRKFSVGDMIAFRDDLTQAGFKWGIDFYVKKVDKN